MRILIADDHALFRESLRMLLTSRGFEVVGDARTGQEALTLTKSLVPDVVLMDLAMPEMDGIEATQKICRDMEQVQVVILTSSHDDEDLFQAIRAGAEGYLLKDMPAQELFSFLQGLAKGAPALAPSLARKLMHQMARVSSPPPRSRAHELTAREMEVLRAMVEGITSNRALAKHFNVSTNTVKFHIRNILDKMHLHNRAQVVSHALRYHLVPSLPRERRENGGQHGPAGVSSRKS